MTSPAWTSRSIAPASLRSSRSGMLLFTRLRGRLPAANLELLRELADLLAAHGLTEALRHLAQDVGVVEVRRGLDDGARSGRRVLRLEDPASDEVALRAELDHQRGVGRG